jgi:hypothetical protein
LEQVTKGATTINLTKVIIEATTMKGGLGKDEISTKLMLFSVGMYMLSEPNLFFFFPTTNNIILSVLHVMLVSTFCKWCKHLPRCTKWSHLVLEEELGF